VEVEVRPLARREVAGASHVLARAFAADPFIGHFLAKATRRRLAFPPFFRSVIHQLIAFGTVYAAERDGVILGVAAWSPPNGSSPPTLARLRSSANVWVVRGLFLRSASQMLGGFGVLGERHPDVPHWYLAFVGIEPSLQGKGIGAALLAPVLVQADAAGTTCYLETPFRATLEFYRRLGFELTAELNPVAGAPPVWVMTRPPKAATEAWAS
jgi:GNAT superfamily N-acetyltransferase